MPRRETVFVVCMGGIYSLSRTATRRLLTAIASEREFDLESLGKFIGSKRFDVTDMTAEEARSHLKDFNETD